MKKISVTIDNQRFVAERFAKEIKFDDFLKGMKLKNGEESIFREIFNKVAGEDGVLQGNEIEAFLKKVEQASGDDKDLSTREINDFGTERAKGFVETCRAPLYKDFIKQLFNINAQQVKEEDSLAQNMPKPVVPEDKFYENGKLVKKIIHKDDGTTLEQQFQNDRLIRETTTKDGKVIKDKTIDKDGNQTFHKKVNEDDIVERFVIYDKNNKKIGEGTIDKNGRKSTNYLEGKNIVKSVDIYDDTVATYYYNKDGSIKENVYKSGDYTSKTKYHYNELGQKTKEVTTSSEGSVNTSYFNKDGITKSVLKEKSGKVTTTTYQDGVEYKPAKEVVVDEQGNKFTTEYTYADEYAYNASKEVVKDGNGKVISTLTRKFDKEGNTLEETFRHGDGRVEINKFNKNGNLTKTERSFATGETYTTIYNKNSRSEEHRDKNGVLLDSTVETLDAKGNTVKTVIKDGNGNVTKTTNYTKNGWITKDGNGKVLETVEITQTSQGRLETIKNGAGDVTETILTTKNGFIETHYENNKPTCYHEYDRTSDQSVFRNAQGEEIDSKSFYQIKLKQQSVLKER